MPASFVVFFFVVADILALAIQRDIETSGLKVPGGNGDTGGIVLIGDRGVEHKFSAFVNDSTVFLQKARHLPRVMNKVKQLKWVPGLKVQRTKNTIILLHTAVDTRNLHGIPVQRHEDIGDSDSACY